MYKALGLTLLLVALLPLAGCGNSADSLAKQHIADMNRLADALEAGKSPAELASIEKSMKATAERLESLNLSPEEKAELATKYAGPMTQAAMRVMAAGAKRAGKEMPEMPKMPKMPKMPEMPKPPGSP